MTKRTSVIIAVIAATLACALTAAGADASPSEKSEKSEKLAPIASVFAMQPVTVTCSSPHEDWLLVTAWGYVYLYEPEIHMGRYLCDAAENVTSDEYGLSRRALAVMVLAHESYHLRKQWSDRGDEGKVQCQAIRHFRYAAMMLGATPDLATRLRVYALQWHWRIAAQYPEYKAAHCKVPKPVTKP